MDTARKRRSFAPMPGNDNQRDLFGEVIPPVRKARSGGGSGGYGGGRSGGGAGGNRQPLDNLYFAVLPTPAQSALIEDVAQRVSQSAGFHGRTQNGRFHISLAYVGGFNGVPPAVVTQAEQIGAAIDQPAFRLVFDRIASFGNPNNAAVVLRCSQGAIELAALHRSLTLALGGKPAARFEPHLTLFYHRGGVAEDFLPEPISFEVTEVALVHSPYGQGRHIVQPHWRWPLKG